MQGRPRAAVTGPRLVDTDVHVVTAPQEVAYAVCVFSRLRSSVSPREASMRLVFVAVFVVSEIFKGFFPSFVHVIS